MQHSIDRPLDIIKWSYRLLYILLFIVCMVVMGYWHVPITYTFLGSTLVPILICFSSKKELEREIVQKDITRDEGEEDSEQEISCLDVSTWNFGL